MNEYEYIKLVRKWGVYGYYFANGENYRLHDKRWWPWLPTMDFPWRPIFTDFTGCSSIFTFCYAVTHSSCSGNNQFCFWNDKMHWEFRKFRDLFDIFLRHLNLNSKRKIFWIDCKTGSRYLKLIKFFIQTKRSWFIRRIYTNGNCSSLEFWYFAWF